MDQFPTLGITIKDNTFLNSPADTIAIEQGVVTGNYFSGEGYVTGAHADAIYVPATTGPITITNNFIEETANAGAAWLFQQRHSHNDEFGNTNDVTVTGNYLIGAGFVFEAGTPSSSYTISNVSITNNDIGFDWYGPITLAPTLSRPCPGQACRLLEPYRFDQRPCGLRGSNGESGLRDQRRSRRRRIRPGDVAWQRLCESAHLGVSGPSETNFVGGAGTQLLFGGQGANILTYLAIGDGGDLASAFDPAKDVIDLSRVDADITQGRRPEFHLHRLRPVQRQRRRGALSTGSSE